MSRGERKAMMRRDHPALSLSRQCKVLVRQANWQKVGGASLDPADESGDVLR